MRTSPGRSVAAALVLAISACSTPSISPADGHNTAIVERPPDRDTAPGRTEDPERLSAYSASVRPIGPRLRDRMRYSHRRGCPVPLTDLRYLRVTYVGFDGRSHRGELVVHRRYADAVVDVFGRLYRARWPIERMRLVDRYRGVDERSMAANNTSAYNCRHVAGSHAWSAHAYGAAIDLNPMQNPYLTESSIYPPAAARFARIDRSATARGLPVGAIREGDIVVRSFARAGWEWGGHWSALKDYQHFFATGA
jgi:poly-gamma-glutamate synthesis protein (capsule biosynthesis protein)